MVLSHGMRGIWRYGPYGRGLRADRDGCVDGCVAVRMAGLCDEAYSEAVRPYRPCRSNVAMPCLWLRFSLRWCRVGELLGFVAQWIERLSPEQKVVGSTPIKPTGRVSAIRLKPFFHACGFRMQPPSAAISRQMGLPVVVKRHGTHRSPPFRDSFAPIPS